MKPPLKAKRKSVNEYIGKLKKQNSLLTRALNEEKKITRRLSESKIAAEQKLDALQKAYNMQQVAFSDMTNFFKGSMNIFQQKIEYLDEIRTDADAIIDECNVTCHSASITNHFSKRKTPSTPTRQVVQPMVGGFTIQRPIVNLARLSFSNNPNERIRNNLRNDVQNVNAVEDIVENPTESLTLREDIVWNALTPVVRLNQISISDNGIVIESRNEQTDDDDDDGIHPNNLQDITNIIQATPINSTEEANIRNQFTHRPFTVVNPDEHNANIE